MTLNITNINLLIRSMETRKIFANVTPVLCTVLTTVATTASVKTVNSNIVQ